VSVAFVFGACIAVFAIAFFTYGGVLARLFKLDRAATTPAHTLEDGKDFVPTRRGYLLAQHFSAISAAGPIVGPIAAGIQFGWLPALIWIVVGAVFIGAMHDFSALIGSVRHKARSVPQIMREHMSGPSQYLFLLFVWLALIYVIIAFTDVTARQFVGLVELDDGSKVEGGGIATASLLYLVIGVLMGVSLRKLKMPLWLATAVFVPLVGVAIWFGQKAPIDLGLGTGESAVRAWDYILLVYCGIASIVPMWTLLQPRGYLGGFFLYGVLLAALVGILHGQPEIRYPAFIGFESAKLGPLFPFLFVTIACGACSGFHGLVCSGTTSKQLDSEKDAHAVGYGGMLLEGLVAVISLVCVMMLFRGSDTTTMTPSRIYALGISGFVSSFGVEPKFAFAFASLAFATFVYDTLDVATRLGRYVIQELIGVKSGFAGIMATLVTLVLPALFVSVTLTDASGKPVPAWQVFWTIFGASNQLLAALTLLGLTVWLARTGRRRAAWFTGVPMTFMMIVTIWSLVMIVLQAFRKLQTTGEIDSPAIVGVVLLALAALLIIEAAKALRRPVPRRAMPTPDAAT
jgi:carbon starvation protein